MFYRLGLAQSKVLGWLHSATFTEVSKPAPALGEVPVLPKPQPQRSQIPRVETRRSWPISSKARNLTPTKGWCRQVLLRGLEQASALCSPELRWRFCFS